MEYEKPSTKHLVLKPKEIVPMDGPSRPGDGKAFSVQLIHEQNRIAEEKAKARRKKNAPMPTPEVAEPELSPAFKLKTIDTVNPVARPDDEEAIRVAEILLQNRIIDERSGWKRIQFWKRRSSRRLRDFLVGVGSIDLAVAGFMYWQQNPITAMFGIGAITLVTSMGAWMVFFVMDDY
jgi:hypothetical protein